jgi:hypothetical protein
LRGDPREDRLAVHSAPAPLARRERAAEATTTLKAECASILEFERFADGLEFLRPALRLALKIAGGEIFDNIVKHGPPPAGGLVTVRAGRRGGDLLLAFYFRSPAFAAFAREGDRELRSAEPLFDPAARRWRGLGLVMCRNLARKIRFRPGSALDRIYLEFGGESPG